MKRNRKPIKVEDLMSTAVMSMRESDPLRQLQDDMSLADIRHMPIVDEKRHVVGIVSDRDVLRALKKQNGHDIKVGEIMTRRVLTVRASTSAHQAATVMREQKIGSLPVIGDDSQLIGIITESDFLEFACEALLAE